MSHRAFVPLSCVRVLDTCRDQKIWGAESYRWATLIRAFLRTYPKRGVVERDTQLATYKKTDDQVGVSFHPSLGSRYYLARMIARLRRRRLL